MRTQSCGEADEMRHNARAGFVIGPSHVRFLTDGTQRLPKYGTRRLLR